MKDLWMDPVVLGALGFLVVGFIALLLSLRALRTTSKPAPINEFDFPSLRSPDTLSVVTPDTNPFASREPVQAPMPVANKDVLEKVDLISQRLVDMQMLLNKQVGGVPSVGGVTTGLSPEMLDKLLKITSTVAQHIEVLQKALGGAQSAATTGSAPAAAPTDIHAPTSSLRSTPTMMPVSQVVGGSVKPPAPPVNP